MEYVETWVFSDPYLSVHEENLDSVHIWENTDAILIQTEKDYSAEG